MSKYKNKLKFIEIFDESKSIGEQASNLKDFVNAQPLENESEILSYLEKGIILFLRPVAVFDCLGDTGKFVGGANIYTDGNWLWKGYLPYFIKNYHVSLPMDFVEHARSNNWTLPEVSKKEEKLLAEEVVDMLKLEKCSL